MATDPPKKRPSVGFQVSEIMRMSHIIGKSTNIHIARLVVMKYGPERFREEGFLKTPDGKHIIVDDPDAQCMNVYLENLHPDLVGQIYRVVKSRVDALDRPAC